MLTRRTFVRSVAATGAAAFLPEHSQVLKAAPQSASEFGKVKIRDIKTASLLIGYPAHLVKVETDAGLYGIGEAFNRDGILEHIHALKPILVREDPLQVDYLYQKMVEAKMGHGSWTGSLSSAISGIETALWDVAGKILKIPAYVLLGGKFRDKLLIYHDTGSPKTPDPGAWVEEAEKSLSFGFKAVKFDLDWESRGDAIAGRPWKYRGELWNRGIGSIELEQWVKILRALRKKLGEHFPLGVDLHFNYNVPDSLRFVHMVEDLKLWFIEDPIPPQNADALAQITRMSKTPICTGENLYTRHTWRDFIEKQACHMIQPDPQKAGGLLETKKIADWADLYYMTMACHNMCTPVGTVGCAHACASIRSFVALESDSVDIPHWQDIIKRDGPIYRNGYYELTNKPGVGIELNDEVCKRHLAPGSRYFE
ncbi:MAG: mandelate racemase/muconate lactonizing enzyme family protein [Bryobacteraceae bacterium]